MSRINPVSLGYSEESPLGSCVLSSLDPSTAKATGLTWHPLDSWKVQCLCSSNTSLVSTQTSGHTVHSCLRLYRLTLHIQTSNKK